jgi:hypothetical protein
MSNNIKVNPFYPLEGLAVSGLNDIIGNIPVPSPGVPEVEELAELITQYCTTVFFNAANVATIDQGSNLFVRATKTYLGSTSKIGCDKYFHD